MKIATWNVNSIRSRLERLLGWLNKNKPDVMCLQELKAEEYAFPFEPLQEAGYRAVVRGQKTYNGVAILSPHEPGDVERSFQDEGDESQARFIACRIGDVRVASVYVPNGGTVGSDKWEYKLTWMSRLRTYLDTHADPAENLVLCGDFNIAPDDKDVANPDSWRNTVLCHEDGRRALRRICDWGLVDLVRITHPKGGVFSWWDYRMLAFPKNDGLRIDHLLVTGPMAQRMVLAEIDREERKGKLPSDHAPVIAVFKEGGNA
ncbi:MAG: exodeoxyribonuclease III [bacterium]